ncbi:light harvesting protein [Emiliania huxleyi CCMP1516]|uniref:Light harvesting protein n=2 Tax=Emiliania huxleyi TaxID=2903 RepID=A0A0D3KY82_EMIH1|nr:light harvesting protein [Emiliania huxleyi CCMP1516]EOD40717.1 light harvesting protein [Emiliania huxleyi CCMP1516]|eukprot:XP_005793146.1 light harvesting protein [Emiliania huxleyi CCMP1516]
MLSLAPVALSFTAPVAPLAAVRTPAPEMFFSGSKAAAPKKAAKKPVKKAAKAAKRGGGKDYAKISTRRTAGSFVDVTGKPYVEVDTFVPQFDEIGVLPPIGRWDPLQIREQGPERYRRFVEMEIKHGRLAMAAFLGVITTYSGIRWPGYLSLAEGIKFSDLPGGAIASWAALPTSAWLQIVLFISFLEVYALKQDPEKDPGDVVPEGVAWARYPDGYDVWLGDGSTKQVPPPPPLPTHHSTLAPPPPPFPSARTSSSSERPVSFTFERYNGMLIHEGLTGNPIFPIGETL